MNKNNLKSYAPPQARKDFIAAVTARAQQLGITLALVQSVTVNGEIVEPQRKSVFLGWITFKFQPF